MLLSLSYRPWHVDLDSTRSSESLGLLAHLSKLIWRRLQFGMAWGLQKPSAAPLFTAIEGSQLLLKLA